MIGGRNETQGVGGKTMKHFCEKERNKEPCPYVCDNDMICEGCEYWQTGEPELEFEEDF
jgi:hypothetical protein